MLDQNERNFKSLIPKVFNLFRLRHILKTSILMSVQQFVKTSCYCFIKKDVVSPSCSTFIVVVNFMLIFQMQVFKP